MSLSNLDENAEIVDSGLKNLAGEVKSLGRECDLVYAILEEIIGKSEAGSPLTFGVDDEVWDCLTTQANEACRTVHELELFVKVLRGEETKFIGQAERLRKLDKSKDRIANIRTRIVRHTDNLRLTLILINM